MVKVIERKKITKRYMKRSEGYLEKNKKPDHLKYLIKLRKEWGKIYNS